MRPGDVVLEISGEIVKYDHPLEATLAAMDKTLTSLRQAHAAGQLDLIAVEQHWLDRLSSQLEAIPSDEEQLLAQVRSRYDETVFIWEEYAPSISESTG